MFSFRKIIREEIDAALIRARDHARKFREAAHKGGLNEDEMIFDRIAQTFNAGLHHEEHQQ